MGYLKDSNAYYPEKTEHSVWKNYRSSVSFILSNKYTLEEVERIRGEYVWVDIPEATKERAVTLLEKFVKNPTEMSVLGLISGWPLKMTFTQEVEEGGREARDLPYLKPRKVFVASDELREIILAALDEAERKG